MKKLLGKLCARRGESLIETLCAILVMALSAAMFVSMARSAVEINRRATQATEALYEEITVAEEQTQESTPGTVTIIIQSTSLPLPEGEDSELTPGVNVWGEPDTLRSYSLIKKGTS